MATITKPCPYDPTFTAKVIAATGPAATPRTRQVISALIQHLHDFAREVELTVDEWMQGLDLINAAGKMSTDRRNEGQLLCDILGLESLVDEITFKLATTPSATSTPTATAILGPFYRADAPHRPNGASIVQSSHTGQITHMHGHVLDVATKQPIAGAVIDIWQASSNGLYEQQDEKQVDHNLRGKFTTDAQGAFGLYCLRPTEYPIPDDGPAGTLLKILDRHPMRPAHIHLIVTHPSYKPVTTQIFDRTDKYLSNDAVFAVKDSLVVDFVPLENDPRAELELEYPILLARTEG